MTMRVGSGGGPAPLYNEGLYLYTDTGSSTSPGWSPLQDDGTSDFGGQIHHCSSVYVLSAHDAGGLSANDRQVVTLYNRCP